MELRPVPVRTNPHTHRGADNLVRLNSSSLSTMLAGSPFLVPDPTDAATLCLPHHVIEGLYGRVCAPARSSFPRPCACVRPLCSLSVPVCRSCVQARELQYSYSTPDYTVSDLRICSSLLSRSWLRLSERRA